MRFDAMVVGNHEFDFGQDVLKKRISEAKFPYPGGKCGGSVWPQTVYDKGS